MSCKAVSSINSAVDCVRPHTLARPIATCRLALQNRKRISIKTGQTLSKPSYSSIRDHALQECHDINASGFFIVHNTDLSSILLSEITLFNKFIFHLSKQYVST